LIHLWFSYFPKSHLWTLLSSGTTPSMSLSFRDISYSSPNTNHSSRPIPWQPFTDLLSVFMDLPF
jgi:hypothetical protein